MGPNMLHDFQTLLALSYAPMPPRSSDDTSFHPTDNIGTFAGLESAPPMGVSSDSMLTTPIHQILPRLLSDYALIGAGSGDSGYGPSDNHFAFDPSADQTPLPMDQLSPATTDSGDVAGLTQIASQSHDHCQPLELPDVAWQGHALPPEYPPPIPRFWGMTGYSQPTGIDTSTPTFIPGSHPPSDALSLNDNVPPPAQPFHLPPPPSSSTTLNPHYHYFIDLNGVRWYQCTLCGTCIKQRLSNFRDHFETHDLHRARFKCDWPGCDRVPFTRDRDRKRHIKEDHLGTRPKRWIANDQIQSATSWRNKRQRKTDIWRVYVLALAMPSFVKAHGMQMEVPNGILLAQIIRFSRNVQIDRPTFHGATRAIRF